jgi:hypothetical protein
MQSLPLWLGRPDDAMDMEKRMHPAAHSKMVEAIPKKRQTHHSYDESVDEPARLIEDEPAEVEAEVPAEENEPVERIEQEDTAIPPSFEEE